MEEIEDDPILRVQNASALEATIKMETKSGGRRAEDPP